MSDPPATHPVEPTPAPSHRVTAADVDGSRTELVGEVNDRTKEPFLQGAAALLVPIDWPEPFGLVMIEALACGTPVIAFRRGSVPEVIEHGVTGFIVDTEDEAVGAIARVHELDRDRIRAVFERRFTTTRMARDYLRYYAGLVNRVPVGHSRARPAEPAAL